MNYSELSTLIDAYVNRNGVQAITGQILNGVLNKMVEQLGRGYQIMGVASPSDDPGLPDGPECWFAGEPGTYTNFGGISVVDGEIALLCYDTGWTKRTFFDGFANVEATVNSSVGTPTASVSYEDGTMTFTFSNLKGDQGNPAEVGEVTASVDDTTGTPEVTVTTSGPDTAKNIDFAFKHLKGDTGDAAGFGSVSASVNGNTGTPSVTVQATGPDTAKVFSFDFKNLKGEPGAPGDPAGFGTILATVNNSSGTPNVNVLSSGPNEARNLTFQFSNLKGETGPRGQQGVRGVQGEPGVQGERGPAGVESAQVNVDNNTGVPYAVATVNNGVLNLSFYNLKGEQGNSGYTGAAGELEVVNNLTDGGATKALSAEMGKELNISMTRIDEKVNGYFPLSFGDNAIDYSTGGEISSASSRRTGYIDVAGFTRLRYTRGVVPSSNTKAGMAFYDSGKTYISGQRFILNAATSSYEITDLDVPATAVYARFTFIKEEYVADTPYVLDPYSIRSELEEVKEELRKQIDESIIDLTFTLEAGGVNYSTGADTTTVTVQRTNYIDVKDIESIVYTRGAATSTTTVEGMAFYDPTMTYISGQRYILGADETGYVETTIDIPAGAYFARFVFWNLPEVTEPPFARGNGISVLKNEINALKTEVTNSLYNVDGSIPMSFTDGGIDYSTGALMTSGTGTIRYTDYIDVTGTESLLYTRAWVPSTTTVAGMAFYDSNKDYVSGQRFLLNADTTTYVQTTLTVPPTAAYARFTFIRPGSYPEEPFVKDLAAEIPMLEKKIANLESEIGTPNALHGKKISIIGDSISCFGTEAQTRNDGYNSPFWIVKSVDVGTSIQSWVTWLDVYTAYNNTTPTNKTIGGVALTPAMIGTLQTFTPVLADVGKAIGVPRWALSYTAKPWWQYLIEATGAELCANASWSGSRIVPIPEGNERHDSFVLSEAYSDYTIGRCKTRDDDGNYITPDVIIVYRGTNDFSSTEETITTPDMMTFTDITDAMNFTQGYIKTILKLRQAYPSAFIILCTLNVFKQVNYSHFPTNNGINTLPEYNDKIREIANMMGCGVVEFDKDGITFENCYPTYISDNSTTPTHPNTVGHRVLAERAEADIKYVFKPAE